MFSFWDHIPEGRGNLMGYNFSNDQGSPEWPGCDPPADFTVSYEKKAIIETLAASD
jgi:hypothetical protein